MKKVLKNTSLFIVNYTLSFPLLMIMLFTNQNKELSKFLTVLRASK